MPKSPATAPPGSAGAANCRSGALTRAGLLQVLPGFMPAPTARAPAGTGASTTTPRANGGSMAWHKPKFIEVSCAMEITRYAPADGDEPILF